MSFAMNAMIHNTAWVTAHFHLIFGGAVVTTYFAIAYELWPRLTGKPLFSKRMACIQLWLWFWGILILHRTLAHRGAFRTATALCNFRLFRPGRCQDRATCRYVCRRRFCFLASVCCFSYILVRSSVGQPTTVLSPERYSLTINPPRRVAPLLNDLGFWNAILFSLLLISYAYPVASFFFLHHQNAPGYSLTRELSR